MQEIEKWAIEETLGLTGGNREEASRILGIGARTLYRKIGKYKLNSDKDEADEAADNEAEETAGDDDG